MQAKVGFGISRFEPPSGPIVMNSNFFNSSIPSGLRCNREGRPS